MSMLGTNCLLLHYYEHENTYMPTNFQCLMNLHFRVTLRSIFSLLLEQVLLCALEMTDEPTIHISCTPESLDYN